MGTATVPSAATSTGGTMTSRSKYRRLPEMSPGRVKPGRLARATLCARPIPDSSIPPHQRGTPALDAEVMDAQRLAVAAHASDLHVHDAAGAGLESLAGPVVAGDALVETDRRGQGPLQAGVVHEIVVGKGLLDHHETVGVELAQESGVGQGVGRVGVDGEDDPRVPPADLGDHRHVGARLDLELDAAVAEAEEAPHPLVQGVHGGLDAQAHPHLDPARARLR